jgi:hypothetical protein
LKIVLTKDFVGLVVIFFQASKFDVFINCGSFSPKKIAAFKPPYVNYCYLRAFSQINMK